MILDLRELKRMHPLLPEKTAAEYEHRAGIGLSRQGHDPGGELIAQVERREQRYVLEWIVPPTEDGLQLDPLRVTEDAAEAITLALVHAAKGWVLQCRLVRGQRGDFFLRDEEARPIVLEVSGTDRQREARGRLREKLDQVSRATMAGDKAACVVELETPGASLQTW